MNKYAPGPWSAVRSAGEWIIKCAQGKYVGGLMIGNAQCEANARLVAAAPELLEAVNAAREIIAEDRQNLYDCHVSPVSGELDAHGAAGVAEYDTVLATIDVALAKAIAN